MISLLCDSQCGLRAADPGKINPTAATQTWFLPEYILIHYHNIDTSMVSLQSDFSGEPQVDFLLT